MAQYTHDPRRIFRIAEWFHLASGTLRNAVPKMLGLVVPTIVNNAFSLELYLKCLIAIETGRKPPSGHNLRWLFNRLNDKTKAKIKEWFDNPTEEHEIRWGENIKTPPPHAPEWAKGTSYTFDEILDSSASAFVDFRYIFETGEYRKNANWNADYIVVCVRRAILELHPEWDKPEANTGRKE